MAYIPKGPKSEEESSDSNRRLYNPYQDLNIPIQTLYKLPTSPEYLFQEEALAQRRSWGENLTYYTGLGYLGGAVSGAGLGFVQGIKAFEQGDTLKLRAWAGLGLKYLGGAVSGAGVGFIQGIKACEQGDTIKLRVNRVLNGSGHMGRKFGNRVGVIGLMYAGLESGMVYARDTDDILNSVVAGLGTGALFKAASGPRSAAVAGAIGGVAVGVAVTAKQMLKRYVPI